MKSDEFLPKAELEHGEYYEGVCRNAGVARWNNIIQAFVYRRYKFGTSFIEDIRHPEDDDGYDLFYPFKKTDPTDPPIDFEKNIGMIRYIHERG